MTTTRRAFLGTAAAAAAFPLVSSAPAQVRPRPSRKKKVLILGGTGFLGPAIVEEALARGHELTLFNRGRTNPHLFPEVEKIRGNRRHPTRAGMPEQDLSGLAGRKWDAVIDTSGYYTENTEDVARLLANTVGQYVFVSSLSVYRDMEKTANPVTEDSPLAECEDKYTTEMGPNFENYGALKAYCEKAVQEFHPGRATLIRPGYIVGPRDRSDRFSYWPARILRGGEILAPGDPDADQQFVDVRDLGQWIVHLVEENVTGPFNAVGFKGRISTAELLHTGKGTLNHECSYTWVSDAFLKENGVVSWMDMPCWTPPDIRNRASNDKAIAAGLTFRPIAETFRATWEWIRDERQKDAPWRAGMKAEREAELLAAWKKRGGQ